ncbi:dihydroorotate dehydrogenase [Halalkalibacter akibai]|uniref:Uncharacterized protein n=1 Tax=Halalkalibacter akibai (strain ATCC 43226 / DSM 21942 / CIP 109018 / JCM 9157 / 1139) TaxID=1236973 RepID=W4QYX6_HALA3|nr:hypothetical protein JCM9157_4096 [Halalkalibacter akibai JCM 9157]
MDYKNQTIDISDSSESIGIENVIEKLQKLKLSLPLFIRVTGARQEQVELMEKLDRFADAFIFPYDKLKTEQLPTRISRKPIYVAINPTQFDVAFLSLIKAKYSGIILDEKNGCTHSETLINHQNILATLKSQNFNLPVITVGGVINPEDALLLLENGADLVLLSSGYVFAGPGLPKRIKEAQVEQLGTENSEVVGWKSYWLFGFSILIGGLITLLLSMTTIILPYDEFFLEMTRGTIEDFNERILYFMAHDRMTLAGTMISGGFLYVVLANYGVKNGLRWAKQAIDAAAIVGFLGILLFIGYGYFDWLHLLFWIILLPFYLNGFFQTRNLRGTPSSTNRKNHLTWKKSLIGQFSFVVLGFSFVIGGITISYIGVSNVFVTTDLLYLCMPADMLSEFNSRLIPVIAHDRAGFGSALLSVGLLVLMTALWGFQQGNRWVWWALFIGGIPAFASGIAIHFIIGYTSFVHLLPAYFALVLYVTGLIFSYSYFHLKQNK